MRNSRRNLKSENEKVRTLKRKNVKPFKTYLEEEGFHEKYGISLKIIGYIDSDQDNIDEVQFEKLEESLRREVAKIIAKLKIFRRKKEKQKKILIKRLAEIKELYTESHRFKDEVLDRIEDEEAEFKIYVQEVSNILSIFSKQIN